MGCKKICDRKADIGQPMGYRGSRQSHAVVAITYCLTKEGQTDIQLSVITISIVVRVTLVVMTTKKDFSKKVALTIPNPAHIETGFTPLVLTRGECAGVLTKGSYFYLIFNKGQFLKRIR